MPVFNMSVVFFCKPKLAAVRANGLRAGLYLLLSKFSANSIFFYLLLFLKPDFVAFIDYIRKVNFAIGQITAIVEELSCYSFLLFIKLGN